MIDLFEEHLLLLKLDLKRTLRLLKLLPFVELAKLDKFREQARAHLTAPGFRVFHSSRASSSLTDKSSFTSSSKRGLDEARSSSELCV